MNHDSRPLAYGPSRLLIQIEELSEGLYLATSDELPGLVAQGRTVAEALDIARDVAGSQDSAGTMKNSNGSGLTCV